MALVGQISWGSLFSDVGRMSIVKRGIKAYADKRFFLLISSKSTA